MGRTRGLARRTARAYVIGKAIFGGCAADAPASSSWRAANPVPGLANTLQALTAFLGVTTLSLIGTRTATGGSLGLAAVAGEPAQPRNGRYRTTQKGTAEQSQRPAPRNAAVSYCPRESVEGSLPLGTVGTLPLGGNFLVSSFGCYWHPFPKSKRPPISGSRLRHWLHPSQAPRLGTGFSASP